MFPKRSDELTSLGWTFANTSVCQNCGEDIEWWQSPQGTWVPLLPMPKASSLVVTHYRRECEAN